MRRSKQKQRIAWFASNYESSLSLYTSKLLIPFLEKDFEITWIFEQSARSKDTDLCFYQIENIEQARFIKDAAKRESTKPRLIFYHHLLEPNKEEHLDKALAESTDWALFPQARAIEEFKRLSQVSCKTSYLPYPIKEIRNSRKPSKKKKICLCAGSAQEWRARKVFEALSKLKEEHECYWLVEKCEQVEARKLLLEFPGLKVRLLTDKSPTTWDKLTEDADFAIHSVFSAFFDYGAYLNISLANSALVVFSDFAAQEYLSGKLGYKIRAGAHEVEDILDALHLDEIKTEEIKNQARIFSEDNLAQNVSAELATVFRSLLSLMP